MNIDSNLSDEGICESKLCKSIRCNRKLTDADKTDAELRNRNDAAGKLTDGDNSPGWHRNTVRPVLEGNVQQRETQDRGLGFVFKSPSIPSLL